MTLKQIGCPSAGVCEGMTDEISLPPELVARVAGDAGDVEGFRQLFRSVDLEPDEDILDVGCGVGRAARPITSYLRGRYEGFDIDRELIAWCQDNITVAHPNFRFTHVDVFNGMYNQSGVRASEFVFPYPDDSFDLVFGLSLFTHLLPDDMTHYLSEIRRVLRPGGRLLFTFFLLSPRSRETLSAGGDLADALLENNRGDFSVANEAKPEHLVAYRQGYVRETYERIGFEVNEIRHGTWPQWAIGKSPDYTQDVVVARQRLSS